MRGLGQELAGRLFPHDELLAIAVFDEVCWIGLSISELFDIQRRLDFGDILVDVF